METGKVEGSEITENKDDEDKRVLLQVTIVDDDDVQTAELILPPGEDSRPHKGAGVLIAIVDDAYKFAIGIDDGIEPEAEPGEKELYSAGEDRIKKAKIKLDKLGSILISSDQDLIYISLKNIRLIAGEKITLDAAQEVVLQSGTDFAVQFTAMQTAFNLLQAQLNAHIAAYTAHQHPAAPPGPPVQLTGVPTVAGVPTAADMSGAKVNDVRLP